MQTAFTSSLRKTLPQNFPNIVSPFDKTLRNISAIMKSSQGEAFAALRGKKTFPNILSFLRPCFLKGQTKNNPCKGKNKCGASENPMLRFLCGNSLLSIYLFAERCLNISKDIAAAAPAAERELRNAFP